MKKVILISKQSGLVITADQRGTNGADVTMQENKQLDTQIWELRGIASKTKFVNMATGLALDLVAGGAESGAWAHQWEVTTTDSQLWKQTKVMDHYKLCSRLSGKCLDIVDISPHAGAHLQIWDDIDGDNQQWGLIIVEESPKVKTKNPATKKKAAPKAASAVVKKEAAPKKNLSKKKEEPAVKKQATLKAHVEKPVNLKK